MNVRRTNRKRSGMVSVLSPFVYGLVSYHSPPLHFSLRSVHGVNFPSRALSHSSFTVLGSRWRSFVPSPYHLVRLRRVNGVNEGRRRNEGRKEPTDRGAG